MDSRLRTFFQRTDSKHRQGKQLGARRIISKLEFTVDVVTLLSYFAQIELINFGNNKSEKQEPHM
jgi:hypothetical protein